jgi:hypothetical protein
MLSTFRMSAILSLKNNGTSDGTVGKVFINGIESRTSGLAAQQ